MISSLSLAQSPSKPGTATVQNHRFQWLQLPPASSRQDSGPKISLRRAGALAEPARHRHRRSQGSWAAPVGRGPVARACSASKASARPGSASATHLLRQFPPARRRPSTSSSHSGSTSRPRTVCGPAVGRWPALTHRPSADLLHQRRLGDLAGLPQQQQRQFGDHRGEVVAPAEPVRDLIPQRLGVAGQGPAGAWPPAAVPSGAPRQGRGPDRAASTGRTRRPRRAAGPPAGASRSGGPPRSRLDGKVADLVSAMPRPSPARVSSQRSGARASSPPGGTGTGSSGLPANRGSTGSTSARRASPRLRAHALSRSAAATTSSQLRPSSSGPAAARCRRATACWAARQLLAPGRSLPPATTSSSAAATETKAPASLAHHRPSGEAQPRPGQVGQLHPERSCARRHSRKPSRPPPS
jgi:hypothetical protein